VTACTNPWNPHATLLLLFHLLSLAACDSSSTTADAAPRDADRVDSGGVDAGPPDAAPADAGSSCARLCACSDHNEPSVFELQLIEMPADSWYEAPGTAMREVCVPDSVGVRGVVGCEAVISAWSGGAYDSTHHRMWIWGGGHNDYWGNELYAFNLRTGRWSRETEPSEIPAGGDPAAFLNRDPLPDGRPAARHTYDGLEYLPDRGALFAHGGSRALDGNATARTWFFDDAGWRMGADGPGGYALASAYDAEGHQLFVHAAEAFFRYDLDADAWSPLPGFDVAPLWPRYAVSGDKTGAIDSRRRLYWSVGSGQFFVWDIARSEVVTDAWISTGGSTYSNAEQVRDYPDQRVESGGGNVFDAPAPGFAYDSAADAFVAWPNAGAPWILDLTSLRWSMGSAEGAPTSHASGGTYGRWRYLPEYNVFILVNAVDENVWFYKHTAGCGR